MDVICVQDSEGIYHCTEFFTKFRIPKIDQTTSLILGANLSEKSPSQLQFIDAFATATNGQLDELAKEELKQTYPPSEPELVDVYCNNKLCRQTVAFIGDDLMLHFYDPKSNRYFLKPDQSILQSFSLQKTKNIIQCVHRATQTVKSFAIWLLKKEDSFVVMDIDGTITKSDVKGYITTVYMGMYSYIHEGVIEFLNLLVNSPFNYTILYLTARPMAHRENTMNFLRSSKNDKGQTLPEGPLLTSRDRISIALFKEVILRESAATKAEILSQIVLAFGKAGNTRISPFILGIGNKESDALAYNSCGIPAERILLIDPSSKITVWKYSASLVPPSDGSNRRFFPIIAAKSGNNSGTATPTVKDKRNTSKEKEREKEKEKERDQKGDQTPSFRSASSSFSESLSQQQPPTQSFSSMIFPLSRQNSGKQLVSVTDNNNNNNTVTGNSDSNNDNGNHHGNPFFSGGDSDQDLPLPPAPSSPTERSSSLVACPICGMKDGNNCSCDLQPRNSSVSMTSALLPAVLSSLPLPLPPPLASAPLVSSPVYIFNTYNDEQLLKYIEYLHGTPLA
jgi:hypothetical protein